MKQKLGQCPKCRKIGEITFRCTKPVVDEETGETIKKGKRFPICLDCVRS